MKIYIAIVKDRHTDTEAHPFSTPEKAIEFSRAVAKEYCRFPEDYLEKNYSGWLFFAEYSCEGDSVWVMERELDALSP